MQIKNIRIENFRKIEEMNLAPQKLTVLVGPNGAGKSSVLEAIRFALTGKTNSNPLIRSGAASATVECELFGSTVTRTAGKHTTVKMDGKTTTQKSVQQFIESATGATHDTIRVATSSNLLASMDAGKLSDYLVSNGLIPVEIDFDKMKDLYPMSPAVADELAMMFPAAPIKFGLDNIEDVYQQYFSMRPSLKKELAAKKAEAEIVVDPPLRKKAQVDADMQRLMAQKAQEDAYHKLLQIYDDAIARRARTLEQISEVERRIREEAVESVDPNELTALNAQMKRLTDAEMATRRTIQTLQMNIDMFQRTLDNLGKPVCPISSKLVCTTDKTSIKEELTQLVTQNAEELNAANATMEKIKASIQSINAKLENYQKRLAARQQYEALHAQRKAMIAAVPEIPEKPIAPAVTVDLSTQWEKLEQEKQQIVQYDAVMRAKRAVADLEKQLATVEEMIKILCSKGGVREKIVEFALAPMVDHCNLRAKSLKADFEIALRADEGVRIFCSPSAGTDFYPLESVSSGEQAFVLLLVMDAINALSGIGVLVLDDLDKLDENALDALFSLLSDPDVNSPYDHIFLAMVNHEDTMRVLKKHEAIINDLICV